jgi:ribosome-binding protein aMBF1 (putative translation factor)
VTGAADRVPSLRKAHTVYERFRRSGRPVPFRVRLLDARYHAQFAQAPTGSPAVAARIRQARKRAGMTRRHLALAVGVTESAVGKWERAWRTPGPESWVQLELALGPLGVVREADPKPEAATEASAA